MVAWRELPDDGPGPKTVTPTRDELCAVPIGEFRKFLDKALKNKKRREAWTWSAIDHEWQKVTSQDADLLRPGMVLIWMPGPAATMWNAVGTSSPWPPCRGFPPMAGSQRWGWTTNR